MAIQCRAKCICSALCVFDKQQHDFQLNRSVQRLGRLYQTNDNHYLVCIHHWRLPSVRRLIPELQTPSANSCVRPRNGRCLLCLGYTGRDCTQAEKVPASAGNAAHPHAGQDAAAVSSRLYLAHPAKAQTVNEMRRSRHRPAWESRLAKALPEHMVAIPAPWALQLPPRILAHSGASCQPDLSGCAASECESRPCKGRRGPA